MCNVDFGVCDGVVNVNFIRWMSLVDNDWIVGVVFGVVVCCGGVWDCVFDCFVGIVDVVDVFLDDWF